MHVKYIIAACQEGLFLWKGYSLGRAILYEGLFLRKGYSLGRAIPWSG